MSASFPKISLLKHWQTKQSSLPEHILALATRYGSFIQIEKNPQTFLISDPAGVEHILKTRVDNYSKDVDGYQRMGKLFGRGLLTTMGPAWLQRRRSIQALFHQQKLRELSEITLALTDDTIQRLDWYAKYGQPVNISPEFLTLVLRISLRFLFSENISHAEALDIVQDFSTAQRSMMKAFSLNPWIPTFHNYQFHYLRHRIEKCADALLKKRRAMPENQWPDDLLTLLLRLPEQLSDEDIWDEVITFMATGHETTGNALNWTFYLLAQSQRVTQKLEQELMDLTWQGDVLEKLIFTKQVFQESLRLYPTIWSFARRVETEDVIGKFTLPAKSIVIGSPYVMHRLPQFWDQPNLFSPERFAKDNMAQYKNIYMPFGVGPHTCIANIFSVLKAQLIIGKLCQRYRFALLPESFPMPLEPLISLRPLKPMRFTLSSKSKTTHNSVT